MATKKYLVFAVDDESEILQSYEDLLSEDYSVKTFQNPQSFLQYFDDDKAPLPDVVVTDLNLPAMTGLDMVQRLQKKGVEFPFILLSGYLSKEIVIQAVDIGVFRLLEKPVEAETLLSTIDQLILERQVIGVRQEIRDLTAQLRELYTGIRLIMEQYIPEDVMKRMIVENPDGENKKPMSFDQLLENLESRLEVLLQNEKLLTQMKVNHFRVEK